MKRGQTFLHIGNVSGRPEMATIVSDPEDYLITMEGVKNGKVIRFTEHVGLFKKRWALQLNLFEGKKKSKLNSKHIKQ